MERSASQSSGTFQVIEKYECVDCLIPADTLAALSPGHDKATCQREYCGVKYYKCDTTAVTLHSLCVGCNDYRCETPNKTHKQIVCNNVTLSFQSERDPVSGDVLAYEIIVEGCGDPYWLCDGESHRIFECGMCNTYHRPCIPHHDTASGSGSDSGNTGNGEDDEPSLVQCDRFGCTEMVPTGRHHRKECSTQDETGAPGCSVWIWTCKSSNARHVAHECSKVIYEGNDSHGCTVYVRQCTSHSGRHTISTPTLHRNNQNP